MGVSCTTVVVPDECLSSDNFGDVGSGGAELVATVMVVCCFPHLLQNSKSSGFSAPQCRQNLIFCFLFSRF